MKRRLIGFLALVMLAFPVSLLSSSVTWEPPISLKAALEMAERYVSAKKIATSRFYLGSIWYSKTMDESNNAWTIIWKPKDVNILNGELRVDVFDDGRIEHGGSS